MMKRRKKNDEKNDGKKMERSRMWIERSKDMERKKTKENNILYY